MFKSNLFPILKDALIVITLSFFFLGDLQAQTSSEKIMELRQNIWPATTTLLTETPQRETLKLALVLSGGGARGLAHVGVLQVFEEHGLVPDLIVGNSMGGIIGGLYACGYSAAELEQIADTLHWRELFRDAPSRLSLFLTQRQESENHLLQIRFKGLKPQIPRALTSGQQLTNLVNDLIIRKGVTSDVDFDSLKIPFRAVATDLVSGKQVILSSGDLAQALRATMAIPLAFTPVEAEKKLLVDGGLVDPLPVGVAKDLGIDVVVVVNTTSGLLPKEKMTSPFDIASQATTIMTMEKMQEQLSRAEVVISPVLGFHSNDDFEGVGGMIRAGRRAAEAEISNVESRIRRGTAENAEKLIEIEEVSLEGVSDFTLLDLNVELKALQSDAVDLQSIREDLEALLKTGFFSGGEAILISHPYGKELVYQFQENSTLRRLEICGNSIYPEKQLLEYLSPHCGERLNIARIQQSLRDCLELYLSAGYTLADWTQAEFDTVTGILHLEISEGMVDEIIVEGNRNTRDWVITRALPQKVGSPFNSNLVNRGIENIYSTRLFEQVTYRLEPGSERNKLVISVKERPSQLARFGLCYDSEYKFAGFIEMGETNLLGIGQQLFGKLHLSDRFKQGTLNLKADRLFKTMATYKLRFFYDHGKHHFYDNNRHTSGWKENRYGMNLSVGQQIARLGTASFEFQIDRADITDYQTDVKYSHKTRAVILRSLVDTLDEYPFPDRGKYHHLYFELAGDVLGGNTVFSKFYTSLESYYPLPYGFNFHPRIAVGLSNKELPLSEKFFPGEGGLFYGFYQEELIGDKMFLGNLGLRYSPVPNVYIEGRYDMGDVYSEFEEVKLRELKHALGVKFSIDTYLGPLEVCYGASSEGTDLLTLNLGYSF
jgi:NTE family protein